MPNDPERAAMPGICVPGCSICAQLADYERGFQVRGREAQDTFLPDAAKQLKTVLQLKSDHRLVIQRCPECGTFFLLKTEYEFLVGGSEDEQALSRLTDNEALRYAEIPERPRKNRA